MSLLSPAAVVYTVPSIYTANSKNLKVSYVRVFRADVPRVWKRLTLTFLWFLIIFFALSTAGLLANILLLIFSFPTILFPAVGGEADHKSNSGVSVLAFPFGLILLTAVGLCLRTYKHSVLPRQSGISVGGQILRSGRHEEEQAAYQRKADDGLGRFSLELLESFSCMQSWTGAAMAWG